MASIEFTKMHGAGNDYVYVDAARFPVADPAELSRRISDRHFGIGSDGLVLICPSDSADFAMRMYNADGSEGMMCGNAARCIGKYVYDRGLTSKTELTLDTASGPRKLFLQPGPDGKIASVTVDMGAPRKIVPGRMADTGKFTYTGTYVDMGNPHLVIFTKDAKTVELEKIGPAIEKESSFPGGVNVEFVSQLAPDRLRVRVWERGSGVTLACGTGACAVAAAAMRLAVVGEKVELVMDGGTLTVERSHDGSLLLSGPAESVFDGTIEV